MKRKCNFCETTTNKSLSDFHEIGWNAFSIENKKSICGCPKHTKDVIKLMKCSLTSVSEGEKD